ncbi:formimidoylglutamase [Aromatoleum aromaticum]|uniref:formimidoylglutamase n=1 Tax=Aromatoleum aromaticum TaxID=551760 RepID=UPI0014597DE3|nr:formimidoylglutamase [Aromatoleum aromaticum]NMG55908.1 formimidoylglutamase [Aromatoleum aromaticum]
MPHRDEENRRPWQGRVDVHEGPRALRWHQRIKMLAPEAPPGIVLLGFPCDLGVRRNHGRAGAAEGPAALRRTLANLAWHGEWPVYDAGDAGDAGASTHDAGEQTLETMQAGYARRLTALLDAGHVPIGLGGGHELAWAAWQGLAAHAAREPHPPRIGILNVDAHFDLRAAPAGNSGTPFRQIAEDCGVRGWNFRYCVLGIAEAANTAALFDRARALGVAVRLDEEMGARDLDATASTVRDFLAGIDWLYLTLCLDALSGACAPGVSAPATIGVEPAVVEAVIRIAVASGKLRLADVAELNPSLDPDGRTARLAARLVWRLAREIARRPCDVRSGLHLPARD